MAIQMIQIQNDILDGLPTPVDTPQQSFVNATTQLKTYFCGGSLVLLRQKLFFKVQQPCNEKITKLSCQLWRLAKDYDFWGITEYHASMTSLSSEFGMTRLVSCYLH